MTTLIVSCYRKHLSTETHSPILGFAYDGNPIYGPYGYYNPLDSLSGVVRMEVDIHSSQLESMFVDAPYAMGTFVDDYEWTPTVDIGKPRLDVNNGRFCVTPETDSSCILHHYRCFWRTCISIYSRRQLLSTS